MGHSRLRPETVDAPHTYAPPNDTAYLMVYTAVKQEKGLIHGKLHAYGAHCAIGSYFTVNPHLALKTDFIDEVAAVNDSVPYLTPRQRKHHVLTWLRWKLTTLGLLKPRAVKKKKKKPTKKAKTVPTPEKQS